MNIGTDVVLHDRFSRSIERNGGRLKKRLFTPEELSSTGALLDLAVIFSIKESISKALGSGFDRRLSWHDICVTLTENGAEARLTGAALKTAGGRDVILSVARGEHETYTFAALRKRG